MRILSVLLQGGMIVPHVQDRNVANIVANLFKGGTQIDSATLPVGDSFNLKAHFRAINENGEYTIKLIPTNKDNAPGETKEVVVFSDNGNLRAGPGFYNPAPPAPPVAPPANPPTSPPPAPRPPAQPPLPPRDQREDRREQQRPDVRFERPQERSYDERRDDRRDPRGQRDDTRPERPQERYPREERPQQTWQQPQQCGAANLGTGVSDLQRLLNDLVTQGKLNEQQQRNDTDRRRAEKIREENDRTAHRARVLNGLNDVGQRVDAAAAATAAAIRAASENSTANHRGTHTRLDGLSETASAIHAETTGIRTDMNAGFTAANNRIDQLGAKVDGLGTKMDTGFNSVNETQVKQNKRNRIWIGVLALLAFIAWLLTQVYGSNFLFPRGAGAPQYVPVGVPVVTPKPIADPALEKADDHRAFYAPMPVEQQSYAAPAPIVQREVVYVQPAPTPEPQREVWMTSCQQIPMDNPVYYNNYSSPGYCDYGQPIFGLSLRLGDSHRGGGNFGHGGGARFCPPPVHYCPPPPPRCGPPHHR